MKWSWFIIAILVLASCNKREVFDGPNSYADGFEAYSTKEDLIDGNNELWSFFQLTDEANTITIDTTIVHSGNQSLRFYGVAGTSESTKKCSINKQFMAFWEGETVKVDFWCYLEGNEDIDWLFIFDLEEKVPVGAGPGMRLAIVNNKLLLEHKYPQPNVEQQGSGIAFPRNEWVHVEFETKLERKDKGYVSVRQNDVEILRVDNWQTLPKDILYANQGTKGMYNQIEFGLTANSDDNDHVMYLDDVSVSKK
ncbi:MAG: heparin lyase I family protein [Fluviicola sp.]